MFVNTTPFVKPTFYIIRDQVFKKSFVNRKKISPNFIMVVTPNTSYLSEKRFQLPPHVLLFLMS